MVKYRRLAIFKHKKKVSENGQSVRMEYGGALHARHEAPKA